MSSMPHRFGRWLLRFVYLLVLVCPLVMLVCGCSNKPTKTSNSTEVTPTTQGLAPPEAPHPVIVDGAGRPLSFAPLVDKADPSVATVKSITRGVSPSGRTGTISEGLGTAFVYDADGYLLTNHHVIEAQGTPGGYAQSIIVGFRDGREYQAKVVGADARTDIAVLKIDTKDLPALPLGNSDEVDTHVGDWVVAIGNPFGLSHTVSAGIVSARGRTRDDVRGLDTEGYFDFLQTDASINPGNSGGPLLNLRGEVVGINAAIRQNANSIGFAIPINMAKALLPMLLKDGRVHRSALGLVVDYLSADQASRFSRKDRKGALVKAVQSGGPADKGGIGIDDIIIGFNGKAIDDPNTLRWLVSIGGVGANAVVRVARATGKEFDIQVTLGEVPDEPDDH
jgi:serine protease Do